jgi:hypothetical protein
LFHENRVVFPLARARASLENGALRRSINGASPQAFRGPMRARTMMVQSAVSMCLMRLNRGEGRPFQQGYPQFLWTLSHMCAGT